MADFVNVFLSQIVLLAVMAVAAGAAVVLGISMRRRKNRQELTGGTASQEDGENS